ncbi:GDYXXLXY domain-containing protein [Maribacter sp. 2308TA10-17]|uniref:GDYXXLXY domain-containing protein n=1 Tax=Maribacter sp. 2308TA10-17 TaxID=3386276 RepID=UPI0039BCC884
MNKSIYIGLLFLLFAVQLFIPGQMIYQQEDTLDTGTAYKFKTAPIDPSDPFRGKYIVLNYEMNSFETNEEGWSNYSGKVFVYLKTDAEGFAAVEDVSKTLINTTNEYVIAESRYNYSDTRVYFDLPFDRFYMNENKAYDAEISVRKAQVDTTKICYGLVFVKDGTAVLDNVFIDDTPIQEFVEEFQEGIQ